MESQTLKLLRQRRSHLEQKKAEIDAQLKPVVAELEQVEVAIRALTGKAIFPTGAEASAASLAHFKRKVNPDIQSLTFKQLVIKALSEHFENGATANEMLEFFKREWGRDIMRTSLSPQLSRLKNEGKIALMGKTWTTREKFDEQFGEVRNSIADMFDNENGEAEASPDADEVAASSDNEPSSAERPTRGGSAPGEEETT